MSWKNFSGGRGDGGQVLRHLPDPGLLPSIQEEERIEDGHRKFGLRRGQGRHTSGEHSC